MSPAQEKNKEKEKIKTRISSDGQIEMTVGDTPLYLSSEILVKSRARLGLANKEFENAEDNWIDEMKEAKKGKINHKGDILQFVRGRTTKDHVAFKKS